MKKIRLVLTILICLVLALCVLVACNKGDGEPSVDPSDSTGTDTGGEHQHTFAKEWSSNDEYHWHAATCGHDTEQADKAAHVFNGGNTCDTCGYKRVAQSQALVLTVQNGQIKGNEITMYVESTVSIVPLAQAVKVSDGCVWTLSYDVIGNDVIGTKVAAQKDGQLANGDNKFYIVVSSQLDPSLINVYTLTIHRRYFASVNFYHNNEIIHTQQFYTGSSVRIDWTPDLDGYTFNCWRDSQGRQYTKQSQTLWAPLDLYADATANSYKVVLDFNGGDIVYPTEYSITYDSEFTLPIPVRRGYTFLGWYNGNIALTDGTGRGLDVWNAYYFVELQAHWQITDYTVDVGVSGNACGSVQGGGTYNYNDRVTLTATTNLGYVFLGWFNGESIVSDDPTFSFYMPDQNRIYTATWAMDEAMSPFVFTSTPTTCTITGVKDSAVTDIVVPNYVTRINGAAFRDCGSLESITLPFVGQNSAGMGETYFGYIFDTFGYYYCYNYVPLTLKKVVITGGASIGEGAFYNCSNLTEITIPNTVTNISERAFYSCTSLKSVTFEEESQLQTIGSEAFYGCSNLTEITIPSSVTSIESSTFGSCLRLESITLPFVGQNADGIGDTHFGYIFNRTGYFDDYSLPDSLKKVVITGGASIDEDAFRGCSSLTDITIPSSVTSIGNSAFYGCSSLTNVYYYGSVESWCRFVFDNAEANPMCYAENFYISQGDDWQKVTALEFPESVTNIGSYQFYGFNVTSITISSTVASIGQSAFGSCSSLESITLPFVGQNSDGTGATHFGYIFGANSYSGNSSYVPTNLKKVVITGGASIDEDAFRYCSCITEITIPSTVTSIGTYAFHGCSKLQSVIFDGDSQLQSIAERAFYYCSNLTEITIPSTVTSIGDSAFSDCSNLPTVTFDDDSQLQSIGEGAFKGCSSLESITLPFVGQNSDGTGATHFGYIFGAKDDDANKTSVPTSLKKVVITGGTSIPASALYACISLTEIEITNNVISIGNNAFAHCSNLTKVTIPSSVTSIGQSAFYGCSNLQMVIFDGDSQLQSIGNTAFYDCRNLQGITISSTVTNIGDLALSGCYNLQSVTFGSEIQLKSIGESVFQGCSKLKEITIPITVTSIGDGAFNSCSSLKEITIPSSVKSIGEYAFNYCSGLTKVIFQDPTGWSSGGTLLSGLDDPETAATYLTSTYRNYTWKKS